MASTIDRTIPVAGTDVDAPEIQSNFNKAADDVEALQATAPTADEKGALAGSGTPPTALNPYLTVADESPGTTVHNDLSDRDAANAHPTSAVTGLDTQLAAKVPASAFTAKADLLAGTGTGTYLAQPSSPDNYLLGYDSGTGTGLKGIDPATVGVTDHPSLTGRDTADSHPTSAVTGLDTALAGKMDESVYDSTGDGVVDGAESITIVATNATGAPLAVGELVQIDSAGNITTKANASTGVWADVMVSETINNGATGHVVALGLVGGLSTIGFADRDTIYCGDSGAISTTKVLDSGGEFQSVGAVLAVGASGTVYFEHSAPRLDEADGALGVVSLTDAVGDFAHVQVGVGWEEIIPPASSTILLAGINTAIGANPGRLALDFSGSTNAPADGTISGDVVIHATIEPGGTADVLEVSFGLNGAVVSADIRGGIGVGGNQSVGTRVPVTLTLPSTGRSDGDEYSIFARGTAGTYTISALSVQFSSQGVGTTGDSGGGTDDHQQLTNRSATGAHPGTSVSVAPAGGISSANVQLALEELDTEKADKTSGVTSGNLASLVGDNLADSGVPSVGAARTDIAETMLSPLTVDGPASVSLGLDTAATNRMYFSWDPVNQGQWGNVLGPVVQLRDNGPLLVGTPGALGTAPGQLIAADLILSETEVSRLVVGVPREYINPFVAAAVDGDIGYSVDAARVVDVTGGATMAFEPQSGNFVSITTTGAATLTISDQTQEGDTKLAVPVDVTLAIGGTYAFADGNSDPGPTFARLVTLSKLGPLLRIIAS